MAIFGADIEQLRGLGTKFDTTWAGELEGLIGTIDAEVAASEAIWVGPDANNFRGTTWPQHKSAMQAAREALVAAGTLARAQADQQESTSAVG